MFAHACMGPGTAIVDLDDEVSPSPRRPMITEHTAAHDRFVMLGRIGGVFGVQGWVKVWSFTQPPENILDYQPWWVNFHGEWRRIAVESGRSHGKGIVARLEGYGDPDTARVLVGADIGVLREQLPPPAPGEYYWTDLVGLEVINRDGVSLGKVDHLFATGANDVMVVEGERERLIPFIKDQVVLDIDIERGILKVDWDAAF